MQRNVKLTALATVVGHMSSTRILANALAQEELLKAQEKEMEMWTCMSTDTITFLSRIVSFLRYIKDDCDYTFTTNNITERDHNGDERTLDVNIQVVIKILVQRGFHVVERVGSNIRIFHNSHGIYSELGHGYVLHLPVAGTIVRFD